jgi:hypothetical protein
LISWLVKQGNARFSSCIIAVKSDSESPDARDSLTVSPGQVQWLGLGPPLGGVPGPSGSAGPPDLARDRVPGRRLLIPVLLVAGSPGGPRGPVPAPRGGRRRPRARIWLRWRTPWRRLGRTFAARGCASGAAVRARALGCGPRAARAVRVLGGVRGAAATAAPGGARLRTGRRRRLRARRYYGVTGSKGKSSGRR